MTDLYALGLGVGTKNNAGNWLEAFFPQPKIKLGGQLASDLGEIVAYQGGNQSYEISRESASLMAEMATRAEEQALADSLAQLAESNQPLVAVFLEKDSAPQDVPQAFLKLQLLSQRLVKPHETVLDGIFGVLRNVAWTNQGAIDLSELPNRQLTARINGEQLSVNCVDKFPKMTDYVVPSGVRIADTARVRLGAYIGEGTTIMHEGFVNFNAGTLGTSMVEGRISAGVVIGKGSDLGGGCSTMGTLSGGGNMVISVGKECLIGANAGTGIPLGDRCTIESGLYITAGTKVVLLDGDNALVKQVKARELAGVDGLLFRRNSITGAVECKTNKTAVALNSQLHQND